MAEPRGTDDKLGECQCAYCIIMASVDLIEWVHKLKIHRAYYEERTDYSHTFRRLDGMVIGSLIFAHCIELHQSIHKHKMNKT